MQNLHTDVLVLSCFRSFVLLRLSTPALTQRPIFARGYWRFRLSGLPVARSAHQDNAGCSPGQGCAPLPLASLACPIARFGALTYVVHVIVSHPHGGGAGVAAGARSIRLPPSEWAGRARRLAAGEHAHHVLFTLAIYALPFFIGLTAGMYAHQAGTGPLGTIALGLVAGAFAVVLGQLVFSTVRAPILRITIALIFATPAASPATMPPTVFPDSPPRPISSARSSL